MPLIIYDDTGGEILNSDTVSGGVIATTRTYAPGDTDTFSFPVFAGRTATLVNLLLWAAPAVQGVTLDTALGYPRVTVTTSSITRRFSLVIQ